MSKMTFKRATDRTKGLFLTAFKNSRHDYLEPQIGTRS